jgi:hypothetical protein
MALHSYITEPANSAIIISHVEFNTAKPLGPGRKNLQIHTAQNHFPLPHSRLLKEKQDIPPQREQHKNGEDETQRTGAPPGAGGLR